MEGFPIGHVGGDGGVIHGAWVGPDVLHYFCGKGYWAKDGVPGCLLGEGIILLLPFCCSKVFEMQLTNSKSGWLCGRLLPS